MKYFSHFRFDGGERKLWLGPDVVGLTRKAGDLLALLVQEAGTTVSHQRILEEVWPGTHVQQENIKVLVHELRHALGDNPEFPRYVQSESGRGYCFVAAVADAPCPLLEGSGHSHPSALSRDYVTRAIDAALDGALTRREAAPLYVEGVTGSGKTSVCQEIGRRAGRWPSVRLAYGRAHRTSTEPLAGIVALVERLVTRFPVLAGRIVERHAPSWFAYLTERRPLTEQLEDPREIARLAFELVDTFGALGQHDPFVLVLEDLHWMPAPALDMLSVLGAELVPSHIALVVTYAPFGPAPGSRPLAAPAASRQTIRLLPVSEAAVWDYLDRRFGAHCADSLAGPIHGAAAGHAASVTRVVDALAAAGFLRHGASGWSLGVPLKRAHTLIADSVTDAIRTALDGFGPEERRLLVAAASVGWKFDMDSVARVLGVEVGAGLRESFDVLATHLPILERTAPHGKRSAGTTGYRFTHRQWFDALRTRSEVSTA